MATTTNSIKERCVVESNGKNFDEILPEEYTSRYIYILKSKSGKNLQMDWARHPSEIKVGGIQGWGHTGVGTNCSPVLSATPGCRRETPAVSFHTSPPSPPRRNPERGFCGINMQPQLRMRTSSPGRRQHQPWTQGWAPRVQCDTPHNEALTVITSAA